MSKIRILAIPPDTHGVGKYRVIDPYTFIGENFMNDIHVDIVYNVEDNDDSFKDYDVVVFHSFIHQAPNEINHKRINWLKSQGIKVIMDIDDMWFVDQNHPMYYQIKTSKVGENKVAMMKMVDHVTTTTPIFAQTIRDKVGIKNVHIFPNAVNESESQFKPQKTKSDKVRFGWLGGSSHLSDIELMRGGISIVHNDFKNKVQFVLCGFDLRGTMTEVNKTTGEVKRRPLKPTESIWFQYENVFTDKYKAVDDNYKNFLFQFVDLPFEDQDKPYVRRWTRDISSYAKNYNNFDVSLAPLLNTQFNINKSQLKIIEAGFHKKAVIASFINPYSLDLISAVDEGKFNEKGNALTIPPHKNHKEWGKHMKRLIENPNMIEDLGNRLYETVKDKYSLKNVCQERVQFFKSIINK